MLGMIWNYKFFSKEAFLQSENEQTFAEICFFAENDWIY